MLYILIGGFMGKVFWFTTTNGRSPVEDGIDDLSQPDQAKIFAYIEKLEEYGHRLGVPFVKHIDGRIKELRIPVSPGQYRIFFFFNCGENFYLLHGFLKKTQKTPQKEIDLALKRMKLVLQNIGE
jgi:phage-related protein